ncbi:MAG: IcmT/TraK family protein [Deltaproteobacteria bacterium]|jgi:intracellular multiplication protein IcmT|nr:IcmT/TraK family protein [Deltaproteobacteria bacterium]
MNPPWAWTAKTARLLVIDARAVFPLGLWLLHWAWWTLGLALFSIVALALLERAGLSLRVLWPLARAKMIGAEREVTNTSRFRERCRF